MRTDARSSERLSAPPRTSAAAAALATITALASFPLAAAGLAPSGLPYSHADAHVVQRQPAPGSCQARGAGLFARPDPRCTPGALNPDVTQATISRTICRRGWTKTVRPPESVTAPEKLASMRSYADGKDTSRFEYDHLVPLELGGAPNDRRNLWPEPDYAVPKGFYLNPKDLLESVLKRRVCSGHMGLSTAQRLIARDWPAAYRSYG
jgi:hypothetical protein